MKEPVRFNRLYSNPAREDNTKGCSFFIVDNILFFNDFAEGIKYTAPMLYSKLHNITYSKAVQILNNIDSENLELKKPKEVEIFTKSKEIESTYFRLSKDTLEKFMCKEVEMYSINGYLTASTDTFLYLYPSGNNKIYSPLGDKSIK